MPFDGRNYTDPQPVCKVGYSPDSPFPDMTIKGNLRNAYAYARTRSRGMLSHCWPRNTEDQVVYLSTASQVNSVGGTLVLEHRQYVAEHFTHVKCHFCFTMLDQAQTAVGQIAWQELAVDGVQGAGGTTVLGPSTTIQLGQNAANQITQGATVSIAGGSYEMLIENPLPYPFAAQYFWFGLYVYASKGLDGMGVSIASPMILDSASLWLESRD